jgi:phosphatidate cytidylyltransferase
MLSRRIITTFLFLPFFVVELVTENPGQLLIALFVAGASVWGLSEFFNLGQRLGALPPRKWIYLAVVILPFIAHYCHLTKGSRLWMLGWVMVTLLGILVLMVTSGRIERAWETFLVSIGGLVYIILPLSAAQYLRHCTAGAWLLVFVFLVTWLSDTGAFFGGKAFGRHKLAPTISPGKTIEGSLSGLVLAVLGIVLVGGIQMHWVAPENEMRFFWTEGHHLDLIRLVLLGILLVFTGTIGDLTESMLKRDLKVKDSGSGLTGHGGFLDIMDSLLINLPVMAVYAALIENLHLIE